MAKRIGRRTVQLTHPVRLIASAAVGGKKEGEGPLREYFDQIFPDTTLQEPSWEKAESHLQTEAVQRALKKAGLPAAQVDLILAGDLLNQCIGSAFGLRALGIPFLGQYGACSTMAQTLAVGAMLIDGGSASHAVAVTSSHFCAAERQFRFPLEYGSVRPPTAQWTVTAAGAAVLSAAGQGPRIDAVTVGKIVDLGIADANNMGAAMAPAAADTLLAYFRDTGTQPADFDAIVTGDLGATGTRLFAELLAREGIDVQPKHADCGQLIFDRDTQQVDSGGSGCGCAGSVLCGYWMQRMRAGAVRDLLFMATGALMSTTSSQQGESIPGIAHLLRIRADS